MFEQGCRPLDRSQGGLGLGLALVRRLTELHGGRVEARSAGLNLGSELIVRLPLVAAAELTPVVVPHRAIEVPATQPRSQRVLVVDDNVDAAESLELLLKFWKHEVRSAHDARDALAIAAEFQPDIALLDIGLPGMNGYDLARRLRGMPALARMTIVALTGYGGEEDRRRSREAGFDQHLVKPATPATLRRLFAQSAAKN
jgi:CheY-like chemotaxis protein